MEKKAMLSQPMAGKTEEEIIATRNRAINFLKAEGFTIVNTLFTDEWYSKEAMTARGVVQIPLCFLAKSLENMSLCHTVYFCKGWENARGCRIEHDAAVAYGLEIIYEEQTMEEKGMKDNKIIIRIKNNKIAYNTDKPLPFDDLMTVFLTLTLGAMNNIVDGLDKEELKNRLPTGCPL